MAYLLEHEGKTIAFTGGHFHDEAKLSAWFDSEWDYGFGKGIDALLESTDKLITRKPELALPSHGPPIARATRQLETFKEKLTGFRTSRF